MGQVRLQSHLLVIGDYTLSGAKSHILTIKANIMAGQPGKDYKCEINYIDATTSPVLPYKMAVSLSRVVNGGGIADLITTTPSGNVFKNEQVTSLTAKAELWRGSVIDTTNVTYQYLIDSSVTADQGGGVGWKKLNETAGKYTGCTSATLTLFAAVVDCNATLK